MRMWMVPARGMCQKHLCGEHVECHMLIGTLLQGKAVTGYIAGNLMQPLSLKARHDELAAEMVRRGYNHNSVLGGNLEAAALASVPDHQLHATVDVALARAELERRCPECRARLALLDKTKCDS